MVSFEIEELFAQLLLNVGLDRHFVQKFLRKVVQVQK